MTYATQDEMLAATCPDEREHFVQCQECEKWWDRRAFDDLAFHCFGHVERADFNVPAGTRIEA